MSFLYREAGRVMKGVEEGRASLKTLTLGRPNNVGGGKGGDENGPKRKLYAMVSETLRYKPLLDELVMKADPTGAFFSDGHIRDKAQGYVMLYEMLLGKGFIQGGGKLKRYMLLLKPRLEECLRETKVAKGLPADAPNDALLPKTARRHVFPRYARVNLAACPEGTEGVAAKLREEGFEVKVDDVVPSLLALPAGTDLHDHPMVKNGMLVLQDKSSCFSAEALLGSEAEATARQAGMEWKGGDVIDACAAPGNKAMHAASLLSRLGCGDGAQERKRKRKVFAFDKDPRRLELMQRRVDGAGLADTIETRLQDFLEVDPLDRRFAGVTAILLDPSCSGSGIVSTPDRANDAEAGAEEGFVDQRGKEEVDSDDSRVEKLAAFQLRGLLKAMSFSQVQRVCYSTCSIHVQENENVVAKALEQQPLILRQRPLHTISTGGCPASGTAVEAEGNGACSSLRRGRFVLSRCLSRWPRRGLAVSGLDDAQAACLVRADPTEDETNGFFVAVFQRKAGGSGGDVDITGSKRRNRHKNRNKNAKKRRKSKGEVEGVDVDVSILGGVEPDLRVEVGKMQRGGRGKER